jgi:hypothetical protein
MEDIDLGIEGEEKDTQEVNLDSIVGSDTLKVKL